MNDKTASEERTLHRMIHGHDGSGTGSSFANPVHRATVAEYMTVRDINDRVEIGTRITNVRWLSVLSEYLNACHGGMPFEKATVSVLQDFSRRLDRPEQTDRAGMPLPLTAPGQGFGYTGGTPNLIRIVVAHFYKWLHYREDQTKWPLLADGRRARPAPTDPGAGWPAAKRARARLPYPEVVSWMLDLIDRRSMMVSKVKPEDLFIRDEFYQMASVANERDGAMVMTYWDTGARRELLLVLNVESYKSDVTAALAQGEQALLDLKGPLARRMGVILVPDDARRVKNRYARGARIPVIDAKPFLDAYIRVHPFALWPYAPLFYSTHCKYFPALVKKAAAYKAWLERCKGLKAKNMDVALAGPEPPQPTPDEFEKIRLTGNTVLDNMKRLAKRAGITKPFWVHLARHSRTRPLSKKLTLPQMERHFLWAPGSPMPRITYDHASAEDDDRAFAAAHGLSEEEVVPVVEGLNQPIRCLEGHMNKPGADFCFVCNLPLDPKRITTAEHRIADSQVETLLKNPNVRAALTEALLRELGITTGALKENGEPTPAFETTLKVAEARRTLAENDGEASA